MMGGIDGLIERMEAFGRRLDEAGDERRHFHSTYTRTTRAVRDELTSGGFGDGDWVERWEVAFAELYLDPLEAWDRGDRPPSPWRIAFEAARNSVVPPLRHVLLGMNAHINYDLPQALLTVIAEDEFEDPSLLERREADHLHVDEILVGRVAAEDEELKEAEAPGERSFSDRVLQPLNRSATRRFLKEARAKVWRNARILNDARRGGDEDYRTRLHELEDLARARVADLRAPGLVILKLARRGFGVSLSEEAVAELG